MKKTSQQNMTIKEYNEAVIEYALKRHTSPLEKIKSKIPNSTPEKKNKRKK